MSSCPGFSPAIHVLWIGKAAETNARDDFVKFEHETTEVIYFSSRAMRLDVSQRVPPIFCTSA